jgi:hypothetical protein
VAPAGRASQLQLCPGPSLEEWKGGCSFPPCSPLPSPLALLEEPDCARRPSRTTTNSKGDSGAPKG